MEWIAALVVWGLILSLVGFLIVRAIGRKYRNQQDAFNDAVQAYMDAQMEVNDSLNARIDAEKESLEVQLGVTLDALHSIREIFHLVGNPDDAETTHMKFVELRNALDAFLNALDES